MRVLVVEDEPDVGDVFIDYLLELGHQPLLVRSAEAAGSERINRAMEGPGSEKLLRLRKGLAVLNAIEGPIYINEDPTDLVHMSKNQ